jgi:hypothetical protein
MPARVLTKRVTGAAEHALRLVTGQDEVAVMNGHVQDVTLADAERVAEVGREHDPPERVDAPGAILRAHAKRVRPEDMRSVL